MAAGKLLSAIWVVGFLEKTLCSIWDKIGLLTWWSCGAETLKVLFRDWIVAKICSWPVADLEPAKPVGNSTTKWRAPHRSSGRFHSGVICLAQGGSQL